MGRMILNGTVYGAGSKVEANPSGVATENLYTVDIDGTIYDIKSGNGNFKTKVLLNQAATSGTYNLADDYTNYDLLAFWTTGQGYESGEAGVVVMTVDDLKKAQAENRVLTMFGYYNRYYNFYITPSQFTVQGRNDMTVVKIVGYKIYADCYNPIIYSTEEREIGVWIDNKPLYQKTYLFNSLTNVPSGRWFDTGFTATDISIVGEAYGFYQDASAGVTVPILASCDSGTNQTLYIYLARNASTEMHGFTIQYTKTTDVAGSGDYNTLGVSNVHYSTDEQVIGTWLDGKPLYQKTVYVASPTISTNLVSVPNAISPNVDTTVEMVGTIDRDLASYGMTGCISYDINNTEASNVYNYVRYDKYNDTLMYKCKFDTNTAKNLIVTIKYTKTTD